VIEVEVVIIACSQDSLHSCWEDCGTNILEELFREELLMLLLMLISNTIEAATAKMEG